MDIWQGQRVRLRGVEPADAEVFFAWDRDSEMARSVDYVWPPSSLEATRRWAESVATQKAENDIFFLVIENNDGEMVGVINTHGCDRRVGAFKYGIAIRREHRRKGYAFEAILLLLRYFFEELRYQKVTVHVHANNPASSRLHERLGFQPEGRLRRMVFTQGQYFDELLYGMTAEEFHELHPALATDLSDER
jgi:RimJ/RimL family protein N-acetyltransferase